MDFLILHTINDILTINRPLPPALSLARAAASFPTALRRAGLRPVRFHDLRHCFGSVAVRAFLLSDVQAMLGHAHITTTMHYVHHRPGADDAARLSGAFAGEAVSPLVSRSGDFEGNPAQLSDTETPGSD